MSRDARSRVVLGVGIPLAAFLFLGALILAFSRILLAVPEELAPWVALLFATNILVGCALAAMIPGTRGFTFLIGLLVATIVIGGIVGVVVGERPVHSLVAEEEHAVADEPPVNEPALTDQPVPVEGEGPAEQPPPPPGGGAADAERVAISAQGLAFDTTELTLPADTPVVLAFDNQDAGQTHNVAIYTEQGGDPLFQGELVTGPDSIDYQIPPTQPGEYFFQCDVHPTTMTGTVTVA
jgi:plastocyanin